LAALRDVDAVVVFEDDTPEGVLSQLRPDIWVKGGDYAGDLLPETALVKQWGGVVVTVGYVGGRSTSELLALARQ
jgi:bifunctional ADP-heptose synthase (sugar kinase/adenylyltransferase)